MTQEALRARSGPLCDKSLMAEVGMEIETPPQYHHTDSCHAQEDTSPSSSDPYIGAGERTDKLSLFKNKLKSQVNNKLGSINVHVVMFMRNIRPVSS